MTEEMPAKSNPEPSEEEKFKSKFPNKKPTTTDFLRKRLHKGVKYFDSGDYNMAKSAERKNNLGKTIPARGNVSVMGEDIDIGEGIPTPDKIPHRKQSVPTTKVENLIYLRGLPRGVLMSLCRSFSKNLLSKCNRHFFTRIQMVAKRA